MRKILTATFYVLIGLSASLIFSLLIYWSLSLDSNIQSFINNTYSKAWYFWPYLLITLATITLFGLNAGLSVYRFRRFGFPRINRQYSAGLGTMVGMAASACPTCGSTLLASIGISSGLLAFPFGGLELKAASLALITLPLILTVIDIRRSKKDCAIGVCPPERDHSINKVNRTLFSAAALFLFISLMSWNFVKNDPFFAKFITTAKASTDGKYPLYEETKSAVVPDSGYQPKIILGDSILKLVKAGVINIDKFKDLYKDTGFPIDFKDVLTKPLDEPVLLTKENAPFYINILWPLGLSNHMDVNDKGPVATRSLFGFSSTSGWTLGDISTGGAYFNSEKIVKLTPGQEVLVQRIAENSYRPCCNNSTFFQDCNHGSALMGLLELGVSQGLSEKDLWREALAFNSYWFPEAYIENALYLKITRGLEWENVNPKEIMGKKYSTAAGNESFSLALKEMGGIIPPTSGSMGGSDCNL